MLRIGEFGSQLHVEEMLSVCSRSKWKFKATPGRMYARMKDRNMKAACCRNSDDSLEEWKESLLKGLINLDKQD